ncbi:hypothetical protein [Streptomyces sp. NPDC002133]|uniref:hypothetical protein n=1 Tax=Streptomyces sp. NPDC002133 TaxID=3154409 RepID=UPI003319D622
MRMFFEPEDPEAEDEFEAACSLLVDRFQRWAREEGLDVDPFVVEAALDYRHRGTPDGRLGLWDPRHVEEFLLEWLPRTMTLLPGDELADAPGTLHALLRYLNATHLVDPRGASLAEGLSAIDAAAPRYAGAMADRSRWGIAKFWVTTAAEQGVDVHDEQAMHDFVERAQRGEVPYDRNVLDTIVQRHMTRGPGAAHRAEPQLPVTLPGDDVLREQAERSPALGWLRGLTEWAGRDGRALTGTGRLRLADARELVEQLGTGDATAGVRSSADLPRLGLVLEWAKAARLVRVAKGRLYAVAKAEPLLRDPLSLWRRAFEAFFELRGPLIGPRSGWHVESMLFDAYDDVLPDVLATLYSLPYPMPWPRLRDSVHLAYRDGFQLGGFGGHSLWLEDADRDLRTVLAALEDLGAIARDQGMADPVFLDLPLDEGSSEPPAGMPPELAQLLGAADADEEAAERARELKAELTAGPVELIRLTALGTESVRRRLLAEGRDAPLVGELAQAPAAGLLGVLAEHYDPDSARAELAVWIAAHSDPQAAGEAHAARDPLASRDSHTAVDSLTDAIRAMPFRTRAEAMLDVLVEALDDGETLLRSLRTDPALAPTALSVLVRRDILDPEDLTEAETLLMVAESLLQLLEAAGPDGVIEMLRDQGPQAEEALAAALASGHPDREAIAELGTVAGKALGRPRARVGRVQRGSHGRGRGPKRGKRRR